MPEGWQENTNPNVVCEIVGCMTTAAWWCGLDMVVCPYYGHYLCEGHAKFVNDNTNSELAALGPPPS